MEADVAKLKVLDMNSSKHMLPKLKSIPKKILEFVRVLQR